jgi:hypothetical protein
MSYLDQFRDPALGWDENDLLLDARTPGISRYGRRAVTCRGPG